MVSGTILEYFEDVLRGCFEEESQKYLSFFNGDCRRVVMTITIPYTLHSKINDHHFYEYTTEVTKLISEKVVRYGFELNKDYVIDVIRTK